MMNPRARKTAVAIVAVVGVLIMVLSVVSSFSF